MVKPRERKRERVTERGARRGRECKIYKSLLPTEKVDGEWSRIEQSFVLNICRFMRVELCVHIRAYNPNDLPRQIELELKPRLAYQARCGSLPDLVAIWLKAVAKTSVGIKLLTRLSKKFCMWGRAVHSTVH